MADMNEAHAKAMLEAALVIALVLKGRPIRDPRDRDDVIGEADVMADDLLEHWRRNGVKF